MSSAILGFLRDPQAVLITLSMLVLLGALVHIVNANNPLEWWHFIATRHANGKHYADIDKLGKLVAIVVSSILMLFLAYNGKLDQYLLGTYLAFCGGVAGYSAFLRAKYGAPDGRADGEAAKGK